MGWFRTKDEANRQMKFDMYNLSSYRYHPHSVNADFRSRVHQSRSTERSLRACGWGWQAERVKSHRYRMIKKNRK